MLSLKTSSFDLIKPADTVALFCSEEQLKDASYIPSQLSLVFNAVEVTAFKAKAGTSFYIALKNHQTVIVVGLGKHSDITPELLRNAGSTLVDACRSKGIVRVHLVMPHLQSTVQPSRYIAEGVYLSNYAFEKYKTKKNEDEPLLQEAYFVSDSPSQLMPTLKEIEVVCSNTLNCRDLVNEITENANPVTITKLAKTIARESKIKCTMYTKDDIAKLNMGLLLAVGRGSVYPPHLVIMHYNGAPAKKESIAIIGKGITFDTGGLNLKTSGHIETMRADMAGAAACIYAINAAASMKLPVNVYAVIPLAENMISHTAFKPGDVFTSHNGKTVEIGNTDAEGRLILADAIAYTEKKFKPKAIIDIATLTGACIVSLGEIVAAYLSNDESLSSTVFEASELTGERIWRLPLYKEYNEDIKSDIADMVNVSAQRAAGTIIGAIFLKNFVETTPWVHIDIAGTAWYSKKRGYQPKNATGFGVRLLYECLKMLA